MNLLVSFRSLRPSGRGRILSFCFGVILLPTSGLCQTTDASTNTTAVALAQTVQLQARSALMTTVQPTSIVLDGTFTSTEGSRTQNGNAHLTVGSDGSFVVNLSRTIGVISESRTVSYGIPACTWTDQANVVHNSSSQNCLQPAWFFPGLTVLIHSSDATLPAWTPSSYSTDALGEHLQFQFVIPASDGTEQSNQTLNSLDLVLAPSSQLPQYALFVVHPDSGIDASDIQVKIAYSDYRSTSGVMIPFHIQRYVNGSLVLDLAIATASVQ